MGDPPAQDLHEAGIGAEHPHRLRVIAAVFEALEHLRPDCRVVDLGQSRDRVGFLRRELGTDAHFARQRVGIERRLGEKAQYAERRRADDFQGVDDLLPESRDDRGHGHHRGDADHDAEDRQRGAHFVRAQLIEGDAPPFADRMERHYSCRSASIGSSRAARCAG